MGCGASAHPVPKEDGEGDETFVEDVCWAKKSAPPSGDGELFSASGKATGSSNHGSAPHNVVTVLDAEDDDDEIEIIYETALKVPKQLEAANGQEPPDFISEPEVRMPAAKPLSKQQQEEAAKLAERRKRFDNDRYQREQRGSADAAMLPFDVPGVGNSGGYPGPDQPERIESRLPSVPKTDMIFGLNVTEGRRQENSDMGGCIPPGCMFDDDVEFTMAPAMKNRHQQHDDVKSSGFDADDEILMKEILENCED